MRDYPEIWIIRHGQTEWNRAGIMQGALDSPLTGLGRQQARAMHGLLARTPPPADAMGWVSPQGRAQETAAITLAGHFTNWTTDARLAEVDVGEIGGMTLEDATGHFPETFDAPGRFAWHFRAPGGESWDDFSGRIEAFLDQLAAPAVIVAHGIVSRVMRLLALGLPRAAIEDLPGGQGVIHRVRGGRTDVLTPAKNDLPGAMTEATSARGG